MLPKGLLDLLKSKKAMAALLAGITNVILLVASKKGWGIDEATAKTVATHITGLVAVYVGAQGVADHGKEAAIVVANGKPKIPADSGGEETDGATDA